LVRAHRKEESYPKAWRQKGTTASVSEKENLRKKKDLGEQDYCVTDEA